jgi:AcrR family transcriptional regulator
MNELDTTATPRRRLPKAESRPGSRSAAREKAILAAVAELVAEIGYERVTVDAIAERARASKATMYRKWPGKAELVADALRRQAENQSAELPDTGSVRGDLLWIVRSIAQTFTGTKGGPSLVSLVEAIRADTVLRQVVDAQIQERSRHDGALVCARALARGEQLDASRSPAVVGLALAHLFLRTLLGGEPPGEAEQRDFVEQILLPLMNAPA